MKSNLYTLGIALAGALLVASQTLQAAVSDTMQPHLETRHGVRQLVVDGKPILVLSGELHNSSASSREYMKSIWPVLAQRNLNTVVASLTWELIEPQEGKFDFTTVDNCIEDARQSHLHLIFLWFASWKNGLSSYQPLWVKTNPQRFPWIKDRKGNTIDILSTFGDATRDADARAFAAVMRHIREVDGKQHTVLMMQIENEVGVRDESRDYSPAANEAFAKPVPKDLMNYLARHKDNLMPELHDIWAANGSKASGTWEEVFGPGKPDSAKAYNDLTQEEKDTLWRQASWPSDEIFMAWRYSTYINKVAASGKAEYDIPMFCNAWLQQPGSPRPGEYPCGGPQPRVHDIWRFGAPSIDILAPDLYLPQFDETCARFTQNGNALFIPEANTGGSASANALICLLKYNGIGFSPFGIESFGGGGRGARGMPGTNNASPPADALAQTYAILDYLAPVILDNQGKGTIVALPSADDTNAPPQQLKLGDYTLNITYGVSVGGRGGGRRGGGGGFGGFGGFGGAPAVTNASPVRIVINSGPGEYVFVGGPMNVTFTANTLSRGKVVLGSFDETLLRDSRWVPGRRLNGDETDHDRRWPGMNSFGIYRYTVYQRE
jgi:hypothetical protein